MTRYDEFMEMKEHLMGEVETPVPDFSNAKKRYDRHKVGKKTTKTLTSSVCAFILMINLFPSVALAVSRVPFLGELAKIVDFSASLSRAVEEEYVQYLGETQSKDGYTVTLEHMIVDAKRVNLFFTAEDSEGKEVHVYPSFVWDGMSENELGNTSLHGDMTVGFVLFSDEIVKDPTLILSRDFTEEVPEEFTLELRIRQQISDSGEEITYEQFHEEETIGTTFEFIIQVDPYFLGQGELLEVNQSFEVDGESITVTTMEVYPSHIQITLKEDETHSKKMKEIDFYLENDKGEKFEAITNGQTASWNSGKPLEKTYYLESDFFSKSENLTLYIREVKWLDKELEQVAVNLEDLTCEWLPEGAEFLSADLDTEHGEGDYALTFRVYNPPVKTWFSESFTSRSVWDGNFYTVDGQEEGFNGMSNRNDTSDDQYSLASYYLPQEFYSEIIYMTPSYTSVTELGNKPMEIPLF
ncbi:MAG: DUF4179 domain-containing protein [Eubacteriales bacterium]